LIATTFQRRWVGGCTNISLSVLVGEKPARTSGTTRYRNP
jgi:hypothetical protein